jgi:acyl-CoA-binding protein
MKVKDILPLSIALLFLVSCSSNRQLLIKRSEYSGWRMVSYHLYTADKEFSETLKDSYHLYNGYGLKTILLQEIEGPNTMAMKVDIYKMKDRQGANGLYRRYQSFTQLPIGDEGSESPGLITFSRRNYFVKISALRNMEDKDNYLKDIAEIIDRKLKH